MSDSHANSDLLSLCNKCAMYQYRGGQQDINLVATCTCMATVAVAVMKAQG
eukprot:CAMPEP_0202909530 /NCGR_PEP_ID=MMETSP1392-20130828/49577_1 /ASSEMBLY_ACC=CAM_ASM_000868 /TAXON_ID=225041 /ORGANISM="Chlamydomonas chlamydogama, Strain SAG 11-48b" /LENGTH=50 /DNA_ID=CAMNT_0049599319 /DNA_START=61 /DNA_END=213 /DNA_ORIENTATION=+